MGGLLSLRVWWFDDEGKTGEWFWDRGGKKMSFVSEVNKPVGRVYQRSMNEGSVNIIDNG